MEECLIGDLVQFQRGYDLIERNTMGGCFPVVTSNGIMAYHNKYKVDASIVIGRSGTIGKPQIIQQKFWPHNTTLFVKDFKGNDIFYIYYLLLNFGIERLKSGSNIPTLNRNHLHPIRILAEKNVMRQKQTVRILKNLDKKISLNNSIISKIEEMAKTIYEYWFLQFDFPNSSGLPYKTSGGAMKYSEELGREIPIDWEIIEVDKICKLYSGFAFKSAQYVEEGKYRLITIKNVQESGVILEPANFIDELPKKLPDFCMLKQEDILMSLTGNVGRVGLMFNDMCLLNQRVAKICPFDDEMRGLIYFLFKSDLMRFKMKNMAGGTSQDNLSPIEVGKIHIPYNEKIFRSFSKLANQCVAMMTKKQYENQKLACLRDWLLPMLMNGQARVE